MEKLRRGVVLEVNKSHIILLAPGGEYIQIKHPGGDIRCGEEISYSISPPAWPKVAAAAVCLAAAVLVLLLFIPSAVPFTDMLYEDYSNQGYLALDINPSLELSFNEKSEVTALESMNDDSHLLLKGMADGACLFDTVVLLLERSGDLGYLETDTDNNLILVTIVQIEGAYIPPEFLADLIEEQISDYGISSDVGIFEAGRQDRNKALEKGISLNRYLLLESLNRQGERLVFDDALPARELLSGLKDRLPFSAYRTNIGPVLQPRLPLDTDGLPGSLDSPDDFPAPAGSEGGGRDEEREIPLPDQTDKKKDGEPGYQLPDKTADERDEGLDLPEVPTPVPPVPDEKPGAPD